ncbi:cytochrome c oxidase subunit VIIe [Heterostelium album PN500]|uniref:Cytochrome c oxidase subunit VIIe n=1 Tax=Heterostelium pallidum (strain ATCC 26659 / Pp 5 / PN500) TaxID=670386 RepID=D3BCT8_HETP5|nr:cytochrome c oxidase subunit VIIe [Heterostelium album PN500]EFA80730.1 cytochrome c oxidase subunit VIIe [Heterostelium album PN500]|eukprot:XP_020432850.1 cytochrome c oxidase subunit VIIe [Heterostelium album PN500]
MTLVLPAMIKTQLVKDIGYGLLIGTVPALYFKHRMNQNIKAREDYYAALDKAPINDEAI